MSIPSLDVTRSTKSILKESFFNVIQNDIYHTLFIEAFAGSGSIGLEAISRGAYEANFIEKNKDSYKILENNCKKIQIKSCKLFLNDTFKTLPNILNQNNNNRSIILYLDPPFHFRENMENIYNETFEMVKNINNENILYLVFEYYTKANIPDNLGKFYKNKIKKFGNSSLAYFKIKK